MEPSSDKGTKLLGILSFIGGLSLIIFLIYVFFTLPTLSAKAIGPIIIAIILAGIGLFVLKKLDESSKIQQKFEFGKLNFRWIFITICGLIPILIGAIIYFSLTGESIADLDLDINELAHVAFVYNGITGLALFIAGLFGYLGLKNIRSKYPKNQLKRGILGFFSVILIIGVPIGSYFFQNYAIVGYVGDKYIWDDGPWLTWEDDPRTTITISWLTKSPTSTKLAFGSSESSMTEQTFSEEKEYLHHARITDLTPNTTYYYSIDLKFTAPHDTNIFHFRTAPNGNEDFKFVVVGDMQPTDTRTKTGGLTVAKGIAAVAPDFVVQIGDVSSSGGSASLFHNFLSNMPVYGSQAPFQGPVGNHDYSGDGSKNYRNILPRNYNSTQGNYYSFDYGNAHFTMIDNMVKGDEIGIQTAWVEKDISEAKARGQTWLFISFHITMLTTGTSTSDFDLQKWIIPIADKYDATGVFFGHDHHYEHWNYTYGANGLLYNQTDNPSGNETHIWCTGGGGANLEVDYGVLTHATSQTSNSMWNISAGATQDVVITKTPWNASRYVDNATNQIYADSPKDQLYYHYPPYQSYSTATELFGYDYGEQALHYMMVEISDDGHKCTISTRYPNGNLLMGPDNLTPQQWTFIK